jgi:hypothetical protein
MSKVNTQTLLHHNNSVYEINLFAPTKQQKQISKNHLSRRTNILITTTEVHSTGKIKNRPRKRNTE